MTSTSPPKAGNGLSGTDDNLHTASAFFEYSPTHSDDDGWQNLNADNDLILDSQSDEATADVLRDLAALSERTNSGVCTLL
jgi:hypothetical protein